MLLPVTTPSEPGGSTGVLARHLADMVVVAVPSGSTGLPERRRQPKGEAEDTTPAFEIAPTAAGSPEPAHALSHRMSRWEPVARALGHATQAIVGFLRSVGVPKAEAEDIARRAAKAASEHLVIDHHATQTHFESGRLSLKLENLHVGFRRGAGKAGVHVGKAEIGLDVEIPGAHREESGATVGEAEAEIGQRRVGFAYGGPGATPAYADRGAAGVSFDVAVPLTSPAAAGSSPSGPVDVAI